jgi:hypothetical protein
MKRTTFLTATAAVMILAASCGQKSNLKTNSEAETIHQQKLNPDEIPGEIGYQGDTLLAAYRYTDKTGENIVILTEDDIVYLEEETEEELGEWEFIPVDDYKSLRAYRSLKTKNGNWEEVWRVYDTQDCSSMTGLEAEFVRGSLTFTDLNNDGIAEIWFMYIKRCAGDVSPHEMYLMMYDNEEAYTMAGENKIVFGEEFTMGGEYKMDDKFLNKNTTPEFVDYAKAMWEKYISYKWE